MKRIARSFVVLAAVCLSVCRWAAGPVTLGASPDERPAALAAADFDEDGMPDLAVGSWSVSGGGVVLHRGDVDALFPDAPDARRRRAPGTFEARPFLPNPVRIDLPFAVDLLGAGDFDNDGHQDLIVGTKGAEVLGFLKGDGRGGLTQVAGIGLGGSLCAMAIGDVNRADGVPDVVLGLDAPEGPFISVFESPAGALRSSPETVRLPAPPTLLALGRVRGGTFVDIVAVAGQELVIVEGRDRLPPSEDPDTTRPAPPRISRLPLPAPIASLAWGDFLPEPDPREELAAVTADGRVVFLGIEGTEGAPALTSAESDVRLAAGASAIPLRASGGGTEDLLVLSPSGGPIQVLTRMSRPAAGCGEADAVRAAAEPLGGLSYPVVEGRVLAALPMRLNADARPDLVLLLAGESGPTLALTAPQAVIMVTSPLDTQVAGDGLCTLREAITNANSNADTTGGDCAAGAGLDTIAFAIGGGGAPASITVTDSPLLPAITDSVTIDGTTQGCAAPPCIEIRPATAGEGSPVRLTGSSAGSTVRGLTINRWTCCYAVLVVSSGNIIEGNRIGTDATGTSAQGNSVGIGLIVAAASNNTIGGTVAAARNVIAGNINHGIALLGGASYNIVQGNYLGTDVTGTLDLGNSRGVYMSGSATSSNTVGGAGAGAGNLISGNAWGIDVFGAPGNTVQGNLIGTEASGTAALGNQVGIRVANASLGSIGGATPGARNVISGNTAEGVHLDRTTGITVRGNAIGTDAGRTLAIGNGGAGVRIADASGSQIGGAAPGEGNAIVNNGGAGVIATGASAINAILGNAIAGNGQLGIELGSSDGVTANDPGDADTGPNGLQNYPVLASVQASAGGTVVSGSLASTPLTTFRVEFFAAESCDASGHGEGGRLLGTASVTTDSSGAALFTAPLTAVVSAGEVVTATATSPADGTSEFSACAAVACTSPQVFPYPVLALDSGQLTWGAAADVRWVVGELAHVGTYSTTGGGTLLGAAGLDIGADHPAAGTGRWYLVRPLTCGSWQTTLGSEPARDTTLP